VGSIGLSYDRGELDIFARLLFPLDDFEGFFGVFRPSDVGVAEMACDSELSFDLAAVRAIASPFKFDCCL
jgi:hypothetical protein